jgi:hypothetical protein
MKTIRMSNGVKVQTCRSTAFVLIRSNGPESAFVTKGSGSLSVLEREKARLMKARGFDPVTGKFDFLELTIVRLSDLKEM